MTVAELRATEPERPPGYDNVIGPRARFGVIAPSTNTTVEADLWAVRPSGVSFHTGRMYIPSPRIASDEDFSALIGQIRASIETAVRDVMTCFPTYMLMGMSAETFWGGIKGNDGFVDRIQEAVGHDTGLTTGANAVISALEALGVAGNANKNIAVITPYQPIGDKNVRLFFEDSGYNVRQVLGLRCENAHDAIALLPDHQVMDAVRRVDGDDVDAIIQVGTNLSTATLFPVIEKWLAKPVLPINVATVWHALRSCGVTDQYDHLGRLFEEH